MIGDPISQRKPSAVGRPHLPGALRRRRHFSSSRAAAKVLRVAADPPYLLHLEFVTGHDAADLPCKLHVRNGLLEDRHGLLVLSVAVLLRPEADSPQLTGVYERRFPTEPAYLIFRYQVV